MARWLVPLTGERFDTEGLPHWFPDGDVFALEESGRVYLTGPALESLSGPSEVRNAATRTLNDFAGVITLLSPNFRKPAVDTSIIREEDDGARRVHHILIAEPGHFRMKAHGDLTIAGQEAPRHTQAQQLLRAAKSSPRLEVALALWAEPNASWPQLYRVMEEIEAELGEPLDCAGLCSRNERDRFTRTANSAEIAGGDARHARGRFEPPTNPMTRPEGRTFIRRILDEVLRRAGKT
jgi:hypothetical protein